MKRLIPAVVALLILAAHSFADEKKNRVFTNQDLQQYKRPSDTRSPAYEPYRNKNTNAAKSGPSEKEPKRHIIPFRVTEGMETSIIVPVTLNNRITANMLLDTGASGLFLSFDLADRLGIFDNNEAKLIDWAVGVGGPVPVIVTIIERIRIGDVEYEFIPATVSGTRFTKFRGLVGMDFMTNYSVHIDNIKREVVFEELPDNSRMPAGRTETWWRSTFRNFRNAKARWKQYRDSLYEEDRYSAELRDMKKIADRQYEKADELLTRLNVYASVHSVPLEWR